MATNPAVYADTVCSEMDDTDCACSGSDSAYTPYSPDSFNATLWQIAPDLHTQDSGPYTLCFNPAGHAGVVMADRDAMTILSAFREPRATMPSPSVPELAEVQVVKTLRLLANLELLQPLSNTQAARQLLKPQTLTAWLHVSNACNLSCTYCYVNKTSDAMDEETGMRAVDAVFRSAQRNDFTAVKLKYAGGEATLNSKLIVKLHTYAQRLTEQNSIGLQEVVLTNGVALTPRFLRFLHESNIRLAISIDGIGSAHDAQRPFQNGRGSFEHVERSLDRAQQIGLSPFLSITVTAQNARTLPETVAYALDRDLRFNLNFYRDHVSCASAAVLRAEHEQLVDGMLAAFQVIEARLPRTRLIDQMIDRSSFNAPHEHACGAGRNYVVVDHKGRVAACQMEIEHALTNIEAADPLQELKRSEQRLVNPSVKAKSGCQYCPWRLWCAGGCPLLAMRATGRPDAQSPYCSVYKALFPQALRLEGLRLLKWTRPLESM